MARFLNRSFPYWIAALAIAARVLPTPRTIDDAFITFRYAHNLLDGLGFVYNPGEHVMGTTTPLYTLLIAAAAGLSRTQNYPWLSLILNALADGATCALLVLLGERLSGRKGVGIGAGLLWAIAPMSVTFAIGGMETSVFILLMMATFAAYLWGRTRLAALAAAASLLTRPDALLFVAPLGLDLIVRRARGPDLTGLLRPVRSRLPWSEAVIFLAPLLAWTLFATAYFGSPLTHSVAAKSVAYRLPPDAALVRLLQHYSTPFFEHLVFGNFLVLVSLLIVYLSLAAIGGLHFARRDSRAWPLAAYPLTYFVVFAAANPLIFRWYLAPPLPAYFLLLLGGAYKLLDDLHSKLQSLITNPQSPISNLPIPNPYPLIPAFFLALSLNAWTLHPDHGPNRPAPEMAWHRLELLYEQIGQDLAQHVGPRTVIAAGDVGALGYYSGARILDTVGLMSPQAVRYYPLPDSFYAMGYAVAPELILDEQPDLVVILEVYGRKGLLKDARFSREYALVQKIPTDIYGSDGLLIFEKR